MNFILPHSFELDLRRECHYLVHRSFSFRVIQIRRSVQKLSSLGSPSADLFEREGFYFTDCSVIRFIDAQERLLLLCFYTGEASRLWWASVLLLSEPRQSVHTVRVPYRPSVFAPFCLKSAGLALIWASAVLLWFLALLYWKMHSLSIRRVHNKSDILLHQKSKFLGYMNFVFPVLCSTSPGKGSAPQIVQGHRRHCSGILNRYHRRACSYINLICQLYNPWIIMSISPHPKARKWYRWLRISKEIVQIA